MTSIKVKFRPSTVDGKESSLFTFMHGVIAQLKQLGKVRTSETYTATLKSFMAFRDEQDVPLDGITSDMMLMYEAYLKARGVRMNTISFYMRVFRAVYNRAVEKGLTAQNFPFRHVYTGVDKTVKRAILIKAIKDMKEAFSKIDGINKGTVETRDVEELLNEL